MLYPDEWMVTSFVELFHEADAYYVYYQAFPVLKRLIEEGKVPKVSGDKVFAFFVELLNVSDEEGLRGKKEMLKLLDDVCDESVCRIALCPSKVYEALFKELSIKVAHIFVRWTFVPWALNFRARADEGKEAFFMWYAQDALWHVKGGDIIERLLGKVPIVIVGSVERGIGFTYLNEVLGLQARSFSLLFCSRSDSISRMLTSAFYLGQVPIVLKTDAEIWWTYTLGCTDESFYDTVPIAYSEVEFERMAWDAFKGWKEFMERWQSKMGSWFSKHEYYWSPYVTWERFKGMVGIELAGDLMPLHNVIWITRANVDELPCGQWTGKEVALNLKR
jgi:hypothetical protein